MLQKAATDPEAAIGALDAAKEIVPGSKPTTFQASGDLGLGQIERVVQNTPEGQAAFQQRWAEQNNARVNALRNLQQPMSILILSPRSYGQRWRLTMLSLRWSRAASYCTRRSAGGGAWVTMSHLRFLVRSCGANWTLPTMRSRAERGRLWEECRSQQSTVR